MSWQRWAGIMKCYPFEEKRLAKWEPPYIVQPKYDGVRCRAIPLENGNYMLLSSEENVIFSVPHINKALWFHGSHLTEFDGELYSHGLSFEQIISITSRTRYIHLDHRKIQFHIFDYVSEEPQLTRTTQLAKIDMLPPLITSPYWVCNSLEEIMHTYNELISLGYEGIIVRNFMAPYERKRSLYVMKFKPKQEDNYVITGYKEEISKDGEPKGSLGSLTCLSRDGNTFSIGSGFSSLQRKQYWNKRDSLAGLICKAKYQHITTGNKVPRFPVFMEVVK